uniref:MYND-type domain-containing protein n=1 Tax=Echeneis naucrates TaxID=173247 RepID=A0A665V920_ECHNA
MLSTTCRGVAADPPGRDGGGRDAEPEPEAGRQSAGRRAVQSGEGRREGVGVQEWADGSRYEGEFVNGFKHGKGKYTWRNGEYYEGSFYKDYRHGDGVYCWPTGHKFIGKFYLNRKEGYGQQMFPNGATFQGLYHFDQRFGPGVVSHPDGRQDVGLWLKERLLRFCTTAEESFSLKNLPEYAAYMETVPTTDMLTQVLANHGLCPDKELQSDEIFIHPPGMESYSTDGDHLLLPPGRRRELDQHFYGELWELDIVQHLSYKRDPLATLPLQVRWDVDAVVSLKREGFGPKGPLEVSSEQMIQHASRGELQAVSHLLLSGLLHPDVADSQGHTALIAATENCHNDVIQLLLDMGADIDKLNCEGMSALAVCHVLYYPFQSLSRNNSGKNQISLPVTGLVGWYLFEITFVYSSLFLQDKDKELSQNQTFDSACSVSSYNVQVTDKALQHSAEALSRTGIPQCPDTQETVRKMAAMKIEHRVRLKTMKLLLERGADPNIAKVPMPVLFLAVMAADTEAVRRLLLCGARTDIPLPTRKGLYPLHVAAALPGSAGPKITELLLHTITDPDAQACDHDDIYEPDKILMTSQEPLSTGQELGLKEGGRTALHVACQRDSDYQNASKVVALLLSHRASTNLLWSGHSPLSLAIASGNDLAVEELLKGGADPNIPLGRGVGSALCALVNINYHLGGNRTKLVTIHTGKQTYTPHRYFIKTCDLRIANTPFHTLNMRERETFKARCQLLNTMRNLLRRTADQWETENLDREQQHTQNGQKPKFCYQCGRSVSVKLTPCSRCHKVLYCSRACKLKAWDERHKADVANLNGCISIFTKLIQNFISLF